MTTAICKFEILILVSLLCSGCVTGLSGRVTTFPDVQEVQGATVKILLNQEAEGDRPELTTQTDAEGKFTFKKILPGVYEISIKQEGFIPTQIPEVMVHEKKKVSVSIALTRMASISGRITDENQQAVSDAEVLSTTSALATSSDTSGYYELKYLLPGATQLFAISGDHASGPVSVELQPGVNTVDIILKPVNASIFSLEAGIRKDATGSGFRPLIEDGSQ